MWQSGSSSRYFTIRNVDQNDQPVKGRAISDYTIRFLRNGAISPDALAMLNNGDGSYTFSYVPSTSGEDEITITDSVSGLTWQDIEEVYSIGIQGSTLPSDSGVFASRAFTIRVVDASDHAVTNRSFGDFSITFTRNKTTSPDALTFLNHGDGTYTFSYTPTTAGEDQIQISDPASGLSWDDVEDVYGINSSDAGAQSLILLNQDYGGTDVLRITQVKQPQNYTLYVFKSSDWAAGQSNPQNAAGATQLDTNGRWLSTIAILSGTYNLVAIDGKSFGVCFLNFQIG